MVYEELRKLAAHKMANEAPGHDARTADSPESGIHFVHPLSDNRLFL
jgi:hypothetical protein